MTPKLVFALAILILSLGESQAQTFTSVQLNTPVLQSGIANQPGAIYKYANAAGGNGNLIDAYIKIVRSSNVNTSGTSTDTDAVGLYAFDNPASVNNPGGYDSSFQPVVSSSYVNASGLWTQGVCGQGTVEMSYRANQNYLVHFRLYFKKAGTNTDTALNVKAAFIDVDGFGSGTEAEQNAFMPGAYYAVDSNSTLTITQRPDGLLNAEGQPANVAGIQFTTTTAIIQVTYLNTTYVDFGIGMNTNAGNLSGACYTAVSGGRLASVSFGLQPTGLTTVALTNVNLSGTVWKDSDASANNTFTNIRTNTEVGTNGGTLYVYAIDSTSHTIIGKSLVAGNGTWTISEITKNQGIKLALSKDNIVLGVTNASPGSVVNNGWAATTPLTRPWFHPAANMANLDFGIKQTTANPLQVTLSSFEGIANNCSTLLNWGTAAETNIQRFDIQSSTDANEFATIGQVAARKSAEGSSYTFNVHQSAERIYYRLAIMDLEGNYNYSRIVSVTTKCTDKLIIMSPNPTTSSLQITGLTSGDRIRVMNTLGQLVQDVISAGSTTKIDLSLYGNGLYSVLVMENGRIIKASQVIKQ